MKFSFIIPVYNCAEYLADCIDSVLAAGLSSFEIILIDDGSQDESGKICDEFSRKLGNIKTFHQKNQGVSTARNIGIDAATGDYIVFIDADDTVEPEKLRRILKTAENDSDIDMMIFGMSFDYYHNGKVYRTDELFYPLEGAMNIGKWSNSFYDLYINNSISPLWNKVFKKNIISEHRLRLNKNMFLYEDLEFVIRYMTYCKKIYNSTEIVYKYRQTEDEGNAKRRLLRIDSISEFIKQIEAPLENMIIALNADKKTASEIKSILPALYLVLAREKTATSNRKEILRVCTDMLQWYNGIEPGIKQKLSQADKKYIKDVIECRVYRLMLKRKVTAVRHRIAVAVKNTVMYGNLRKKLK